MSIEKRDLVRLRKISEYCDDIATVQAEFGMSEEVFMDDPHYQKIIAFDVLQIGELVAALSDEFKDSHSAMPWRQIKDLRNRIAHHYGIVNFQILWSVVIEDIPELQAYCLEVISKEI